MATMSEDYDAAKIIKLEIDKMRGAMFNPFVEDLIAQHLGVPPNKSPNPTAQQMRYTANQFN